MAHLKLEGRIGSMKKGCVEILQTVNRRQMIKITLSHHENTCWHARNKRGEETCARSIASVVAAGAASMAPRVSRAIVLRPPSESDTGHIASGPDDMITTEVSLLLLQEQTEFDQHSIIQTISRARKAARRSGGVRLASKS